MKRLNIDGYIISQEDKWLYDMFEMPNMTLKTFRDFLESANGEEVELLINSYGGDVWEAASMYSELRDYDGKSTAKVVGLAASAASFLMLGADKVIASPVASFMIHNAQTGAIGDYRKMEHTSEMLKQTDETIRNAYELKTNKTRDELSEYMDEEKWLTAQDALDIGLVDEIDLKDGEKLNGIKNLMPLKVAACFNPAKMREVAAKFIEKPIDPPKPNENGDDSQPISDNQRFYNLRKKINQI